MLSKKYNYKVCIIHQDKTASFYTVSTDSRSILEIIENIPSLKEDDYVQSIYEIPTNMQNAN